MAFLSRSFLCLCLAATKILSWPAWGSHSHHCLCCSASRHGPTCLTKVSFLLHKPAAEWYRQLPACACAPSVWAGEEVVWLPTLPHAPPRHCPHGLGLFSGVGAREGTPGLLPGTQVASVARQNDILSLGPGVSSQRCLYCLLEPHCRAWLRAVLTCSQDRWDLLRGQGQLFWFSSPSCCREPRSFVTIGTSLACSAFPLFEQGAEMSREAVRQRYS